MTVLESVRGHDSTIAHAHNHTDGHCPKCGNTNHVRMFCAPGEALLPRVRGCELDGEHIHILCGACRYPWIERPLDQSLLSQERGEFAAESEMAAVLAAVAHRQGGISLDQALVAGYRGWVIEFRRDVEARTLTVRASQGPASSGQAVHPAFPSPEEVQGA